MTWAVSNPLTLPLKVEAKANFFRPIDCRRDKHVRETFVNERFFYGIHHKRDLPCHSYRSPWKYPKVDHWRSFDTPQTSLHTTKTKDKLSRIGIQVHPKENWSYLVSYRSHVGNLASIPSTQVRREHGHLEKHLFAHAYTRNVSINHPSMKQAPPKRVSRNFFSLRT